MIDPVGPVASSLSTPVAKATSTTADSRPSDSGGGATTTPATKPPADAAKQPQAQPEEQPLRLVVEPTSGGDSYTYKLFDRSTGALVMELPQDQAAKLSESPDYTAGQVINATA